MSFLVNPDDRNCGEYNEQVRHRWLLAWEDHAGQLCAATGSFHDDSLCVCLCPPASLQPRAPPHIHTCIHLFELDVQRCF